MNLYVVRHAAAVELGDPNSSDPPATDAERPLSDRGAERFADALGGMGVRLARIEHSPLVRAAQTAELMAPLLDGPCVVEPALAAPPNASLITGLRTDRTALVGHAPFVSDLVALLCFADAPRTAGLRFSKGAVAWLEGEPERGGMLLRAFWPPKTLAALRSTDR